MSERTCDIAQLPECSADTIVYSWIVISYFNNRAYIYIFLTSITTELFQKNGYDFNACNNIRDILYNTDIINSIVKLIAQSPVGKLV